MFINQKLAEITARNRHQEKISEYEERIEELGNLLQQGCGQGSPECKKEQERGKREQGSLSGTQDFVVGNCCQASDHQRENMRSLLPRRL